MKRLVSIFTLLLILPLFSASVWASEVQLKEGYPESYVVKKGDTLWRIAGVFLERAWDWPKIWNKNPDIKNPHLIYPGDVLYLRFQNGNPVLTKRPSTLVNDAPQHASNIAVAMLPLSEIEHFLSKSRVVSQRTMSLAPYVVDVEKHRLIAGAGDTVYARGHFSGNTSFGIYRKGQVFADPSSREVLGYEVLAIADADVIGYRKDVAALNVVRSSEEIRKVDMLLPRRKPVDLSQYYPSEPSRRIEGRIIAVEEGVNHLGRLDVVIINRGLQDGLRPGNVLAIYKKAAKTRDPVLGDNVLLPSPRAGELMIFRVFEGMSYALVMRANEPLTVLDEVTNP